MNILLWILQILFALFFLFAGGTKLVLPISTLTAQAPPDAIQFPDLFIRFIGVCETLGALGLVLPGLFRIKTFLTPLAAVGLAIIMAGAVVVTAMGPGVQFIIIPGVCFLLLLFIAYGRTKLAPIASRN